MNEKTLRVLEYSKIKNMLIDEATSSIGKKIAEEIFPLNNSSEIMQLLEETAEASEIIIKSGNIPFSVIYDIKEYLKIAEIGSYLYPGQLLNISDSLRTGRNVKKFINSFNNEDIKYPILKGYGDLISALKDIEDSINKAIISDVEISDKASPELYRIRRAIEKTNSDIRKKLESLIHSQESQRYLQDSLVTIRQDRFVIPVKSEHKNSVKGLIHDQSSSGATLYIEPMAVVELNNQLRELKLKENKEIEKILLELSGLVKERSMEIRQNQESLAMLDFIFAKGKLALKYNGIKPEINDKGYLRLRNARHPLIDKKSVIANTVEIGNEFTTLLITGPNTGGKTVTLKTVGLLMLMAQSGLHIPADYGTEICVFNNIFADIGDEQSIEQSLSTFSSHMTNIVQILRDVESRSLILLDELGAGTDPTEGAALAMSILSYLHSCGARTIATTHYSELKHFALVNEGIENACVEFDVATLRPTYKLLIGVPGKSNAFEISRKLGVNEDIIEHAKIFLNKDNIEFEDILTSIEENRRIAEKERNEAIILRLEVESLKKKLMEKEEKFASQKDRILKESKREAKEILKNAKNESERIIKEIREISKSGGKDKNKRIEGLRKELRNNISKTEENLYEDSFIESSLKSDEITIGQKVKIGNLNQEGLVLTLPDSSGNLMVQVGIMKITVNSKNLFSAKDISKTEKGIYSKKRYSSKSMTIKTEIDIRGMNVEEAIIIVDKYLDDAYISNLASVRIIHGKGTGALKKGILDFLRHNSHAKKFEDGAYNEGGSGVTVVYLK